ncbi:acetylornithine deacetylase [Burkholderia plantarii]|uniref:acetylornithine deacetylase n=1 Tax=Burkholderia plantarii TaxID=41899 RepID=UPI000870701B|nr:acetylornithine deacetylase [Burkholderia plantarii]
MNDAVGLLATLVGFRTLSRQPNLDLIGFVESYLRGFGVASRRVPHADGTRANLYATIGPRGRGGICLSGHADVVPVAGQPWSTDPFVLTGRNGRLYGRGTSDMKGFLACVLAAVPAFVAEPLALPVHIAISYDEEIGCVGVRDLLDELAVDAARPIGCIVGEPTQMRLASAHKGKRAYRCCVRGLAGHSAQPQLGVNAIEYAAELVTALRGSARAMQADGTRDARFDPPWTTVQTGTIEGGVAVNVVPDRCTFDFEIRELAGADGERIVEAFTGFANGTLLPEMRRVSADAAIELEALSAYPGLRDDATSLALKSLCADLLGDDREEVTLSFGTEGGLFQAIGIPAVVCGPGAISRAHRADEYVTADELGECLRFLERLAGYCRQPR